VGLLCGLFNGILVTRFNLSSIVITIGTMSLYRGITYILLGDQALNHYPESFAWFGQGYVWGRSLLSLRCLSSSRRLHLPAA
jgi:rhamnose transport system permease protein